MRLFLLCLALIPTTTLLLTACQGMPSNRAPDKDPLEGAPPITRGLDAEGLNTLLIAELAGQRRDFARAAQGYLKAARRYRSEPLVERAALAARFSEQPALLQAVSNEWRQLSPNSTAPLRLLASLAMQRGDWQQSLDQRLALVKQGEYGELADFAEQAVEAGAPLPPLIARLRRYLDRNLDPQHPHYHDAILATALLEAANGETARAEARLKELARTHPELPELWLIRATLDLERDDPVQARRAAKRGLEAAPRDGRFMVLLVQSELRLNNPEAAETQADRLLASQERNDDLRIALARLYLDEGYPAPAERLLLPLTERQDARPMVFMLLGAIDEAQNDVDNALLYYRQVPPGDEFLETRARAARMLIEAERQPDAWEFLESERRRYPEQASELTMLEVELLDQQGEQRQATQILDRALEAQPEDPDLLYVQAMRAYRQGDLATLERNLRRIIENDPDSAMALNALGYTLADDTRRYDEAQTLIERAHRLQPDSPAILDSLGWVLHKQGQNDEALPYLQRAYALMPDQEVAAHLAEVLWRLGREEEAKALIEQAVGHFEPRPKIDDLLRRIPALAP
ncbi:tetratricopeptide repeat protein [Pistricoccus aurantiacus]|uniref:tetratricopeptide repeat protein n=1 Tax=Pistricoccus aurantiacus TaxID=1883414 RepID=UPI00362B4350